MCLVGHANQVIQTQQSPVAVFQIIHSHRVDVMNIDSSVNLSSWDAEITAVVSHDNLMPDSFPLWRVIKPLIKYSVKPESVPAHVSVKFQILKALFKAVQPRERFV